MDKFYHSNKIFKHSYKVYGTWQNEFISFFWSYFLINWSFMKNFAHTLKSTIFKKAPAFVTVKPTTM